MFSPYTGMKYFETCIGQPITGWPTSNLPGSNEPCRKRRNVLHDYFEPTPGEEHGVR